MGDRVSPAPLVHFSDDFAGFYIRADLIASIYAPDPADEDDPDHMCARPPRAKIDVTYDPTASFETYDTPRQCINKIHKAWSEHP